MAKLPPLPETSSEAADPDSAGPTQPPLREHAQTALQAAVQACKDPVVTGDATAPTEEQPEQTMQKFNRTMANLRANLSKIITALNTTRLAQALEKLAPEARAAALANIQENAGFTTHKQAEAAEALAQAQAAKTLEEKRSFLQKHKTALIMAGLASATLATAMLKLHVALFLALPVDSRALPAQQLRASPTQQKPPGRMYHLLAQIYPAQPILPPTLLTQLLA